MRLLTAAQVRESDRMAIEQGVPSLILMENAASRVVEFLEHEFAPLRKQRVLIICGKGNNGGDGLAIARQLFLRGAPERLWVVLAASPEELSPDAAANLKMYELAREQKPANELAPEMYAATIVIDALLGTGLTGSPKEPAAQWIARINRDFPFAKKVAVDVPSGMASDAATSPGNAVCADYTVTFTAPKIGMVQWPNYPRVGKLIVGNLGCPIGQSEEDTRVYLSEPADFAHLFAPRKPESNKGAFGHVLVIGGGPGKTGAAEMAGLAALRSGAGLATVSSTGQLRTPELMTESPPSFARKSVVAVGPGLGQDPAVQQQVRDWYSAIALPMVIDADGLNALAASPGAGSGPNAGPGSGPNAGPGSAPNSAPNSAPGTTSSDPASDSEKASKLPARLPMGMRVLTPHPGEMARLTGKPITEIQEDRLNTALSFAREHDVTLVLKGNRTIIAFPDGRAWINPTGTPAMATAGAGDILTGMIAGILAQHPSDDELAIRAAVWLHGRCGELCAVPLIATDLLTKLQEAIGELHS